MDLQDAEHFLAAIRYILEEKELLLLPTGS
jgi:hypothetical protein